eukprot:13467386-Alexandrium_andersonii.AAC.1
MFKSLLDHLQSLSRDKSRAKSAKDAATDAAGKRFMDRVLHYLSQLHFAPDAKGWCFACRKLCPFTYTGGGAMRLNVAGTTC